MQIQGHSNRIIHRYYDNQDKTSFSQVLQVDFNNPGCFNLDLDKKLLSEKDISELNKATGYMENYASAKKFDFYVEFEKGQFNIEARKKGRFNHVINRNKSVAGKAPINNFEVNNIITKIFEAIKDNEKKMWRLSKSDKIKIYLQQVINLNQIKKLIKHPKSKIIPLQLK